MRAIAFLLLAAACAAESAPEAPPVDPLARVWSDSIRPGDLVVAVPGTGIYSDLGAPLDAKADGASPPKVEAKRNVTTVNALEAAIAAVRRAGVDPTTVEFGVWGVGITKTDTFEYASLDGVTVTFHVLGDTRSTCATGSIPANLTNYNEGNANKDARDLYTQLQTFTADRPRNITLVAHSWGAVVAEQIGQHLATYKAELGPLTAELTFAVAFGVPAFVPGFTPHGEGFYTVTTTSGEHSGAVKTYELNRPDDPVHSFDPQGNGNGHQYIIRVADQFIGVFGITTDELSCDNAPGICP